ncbi:hypothetical protein FSI18_018770, partial [Escherichia coli]|nr:hypothetical protein [Escherichia coli]
MDRMSVFLAADNESGHVQAVIAEKDFQFFEKFVTNGAIVIHTQRLKSDPG